MGPNTLSQSIDISDVGKSVGEESLFVSTLCPPPRPQPAARQQKDAIGIYCQALGNFLGCMG